MKKEKPKRGARRVSGRLCTFYLSNDSDAKVNEMAAKFGNRSRAVQFSLAITQKLLAAGLVDLQSEEIPACSVEIKQYSWASGSPEGSPL